MARHVQQSGAASEPRVERYRIPAGEVQSELEVKNSIFIGTIGHAPSVEAAQEFIAQIKETYADANHNAWAYRIGLEPQSPFGSSDDGEPGGTAGRPILAVLEGSGLCEVVAVVTRYFGGTKLGTGGLVRAYSGAAREALQSLPTVERVLHHVAEISTDYALYGNLRYLLPRHDVITEDERFTDKATLRIAVPYDRAEEVDTLLRELTNGDIVLSERWLEHRYI
ncbi:MAG TPA: YigZ family protein [Chloroflexi bacterium]|nr:YigZ family protein [Chloroflexota bacterium]